MKTKTNFVAIITSFLLILTGLTGELAAGKKSVKLKKPVLMQSFLTDTQNAKEAKSISSNVKPGQTIYFYYKVGPFSAVSGKGAPYKTNLLVMKGTQKLKDFGWHDANAVNNDQMNITADYQWYYSAMWSLNISDSIKPGSYRAVVMHEDLNSGKTIKINYTFTVADSTSTKKKPEPDVKKINVSGTVKEGKTPVKSIEVRAYLVSDLASRRIVFVEKTETDRRGKFSIKLEPGYQYILKAGVDEEEWRKGKGKHGGTVIDLNFPEEARNILIPIEKMQEGLK